MASSRNFTYLVKSQEYSRHREGYKTVASIMHFGSYPTFALYYFWSRIMSMASISFVPDGFVNRKMGASLTYDDNNNRSKNTNRDNSAFTRITTF